MPLLESLLTPLEAWVASRRESFTAAEAAAAVDAPDAEATARILRAAPALAGCGGRFYSARILAGLCRFLIRPTPFEREQGILIPGHRFLPFIDPAGDPAALRLWLPDGAQLERARVPVPRALAEMCLKLLGPERAQARMPSGADPAAMEVFRLPAPWSAEELRVTCVDFAAGTYAIEPYRESAPDERRAVDERLLEALRATIQDPPPGPCDAARQLLHVAAACLAGLHGRAFSPLAPIAGADPGIRLATAGGEARFVRVPGSAQEVTPRPAASGEWRSVFTRIDGLLTPRDEPSADATGPARLVWRIAPDPASPSVTPYLQRSARPGEWSAGKRLLPQEVERGGEAWIQPADQAAARALTASAQSPWGLGAAGMSLDLFVVLERLVRHPNLFFEGGGDRPVRVEAEDLRLQVEVGASGAIGLLPSAGGLIGGRGAAAYLYAQGLILIDREAARIVLARATPLAVTLMQELRFGAKTLPPEAAEELLARIPLLATVLPVDLPPALQGEETEPDRRIVLRLTPQRQAGLTAALRVRPLPSDTCLFRPGEGPSEVRAAVGPRRVFARRDLTAEAERARGHRDALGLSAFPELAPWEWSIADDEAALEFVEMLRPRPREGLVVEWPAGVDGMPIVKPVAPGQLQLVVTEESDGFGLSGNLEVDGIVISLARILDRLRTGRKYFPIGDGKWIKVAQFLTDRLAALHRFGTPTRTGVQLDRTAAPALAEALREAGTVQACAAWRELVTRFEEAMRLAPDPPASFRGEMREYQLEGFRWMCRLAAWGVGGCLADDMGLGKTIQTLAVLAQRAPDGPALILAPTSVESNWARECARFCPSLRPVRWRSGREGGRFGPGDVVIASYGLALRDAERLAAVPWRSLVLDEAQFLKNSHTKTAQAVRAIAADWRLALTGTPVENRLGDLWSLFRAVCPGLLGSWERFTERFGTPIARDQDGAKREALARLVRPFLLRRTKAEVLKELPPRTEIQLAVELSPEERELYDAARVRCMDRLEQTRNLDEKDRRFQALAALTELRQLACHPRLVYPDLQAESAKMRVFLDTVEELRAAGHRALVFSQFTRHLALARRELDARGVRYLYLDGETPVRTREELVDAFQRGEGDLFLISLKAGGTGLNLTAADYVIHLDPWWNPAVEDQATDRAHRIGQRRPVMVYRLVAVGTIEDRILAVHADKRELVAGIMAGTDQAGKLSVAEMMELIRGETE